MDQFACFATAPCSPAVYRSDRIVPRLWLESGNQSDHHCLPRFHPSLLAWASHSLKTCHPSSGDVCISTASASAPQSMTWEPTGLPSAHACTHTHTHTHTSACWWPASSVQDLSTVNDPADPLKCKAAIHTVKEISQVPPSGSIRQYTKCGLHGQQHCWVMHCSIGHLMFSRVWKLGQPIYWMPVQTSTVLRTPWMIFW